MSLRIRAGSMTEIYIPLYSEVVFGSSLGLGGFSGRYVWQS
jgi:hypothetical protein